MLLTERFKDILSLSADEIIHLNSKRIDVVCSDEHAVPERQRIHRAVQYDDSNEHF